MANPMVSLMVLWAPSRETRGWFIGMIPIPCKAERKEVSLRNMHAANKHDMKPRWKRNLLLMGPIIGFRVNRKGVSALNTTVCKSEFSATSAASLLCLCFSSICAKIDYCKTIGSQPACSKWPQPTTAFRLSASQQRSFCS